MCTYLVHALEIHALGITELCGNSLSYALDFAAPLRDQWESGYKSTCYFSVRDLPFSLAGGELNSAQRTTLTCASEFPFCSYTAWSNIPPLTSHHFGVLLGPKWPYGAIHADGLGMSRSTLCLEHPSHVFISSTGHRLLSMRPWPEHVNNFLQVLLNSKLVDVLFWAPLLTGHTSCFWT